MTDEEIEALMDQPLTFFRSGGGWAARATNEAQMVASLAAARAAAEAREAAAIETEARATHAAEYREDARKWSNIANELLWMHAGSDDSD